jgi:hypothetical protein
VLALRLPSLCRPPASIPDSARRRMITRDPYDMDGLVAKCKSLLINGSKTRYSVLVLKRADMSGVAP